MKKVTERDLDAERDFDMEKSVHSKVRLPKVIAKNNNNEKKPIFDKDIIKDQLIGQDAEWIVVSDRRNFINGRHKISLTCIDSQKREKQEVPVSVVVSVKFKHDEIKNVVVLKDNNHLFEKHKKSIMETIEWHSKQSKSIEEALCI